MAFQRFIGGREKASAPKIIIQAKGLLEFNEGAIRKFALNRFNYAVLYYDQEENWIGVQLINNSGERGALRVIKKPNGLVVPAGLFLTQHGLLKNRSIAYNVIYSGEHDMYIVRLPGQEEKASGKEPKPAEATHGAGTTSEGLPHEDDTLKAHDASKSARATRVSKSRRSAAA